jgi:ribose 5-phosphate isomerase B
MIALGADHAGFPLKENLKSWLASHGHEVVDVGTHSTDAVDYPDVAALVARAVREGNVERGILVCGSGIGMAIAANKILGIRAAVAGDVETARLSRAHNDANVLALGARVTDAPTAIAVMRVWLATAFEGGRHARRVGKLTELDEVRARETEHAAAR